MAALTAVSRFGSTGDCCPRALTAQKATIKHIKPEKVKADRIAHLPRSPPGCTDGRSACALFAPATPAELACVLYPVVPIAAASSDALIRNLVLPGLCLATA